MEKNNKSKESIAPNWYTNPKKNQAVIFSLLFLVGLILLGYAATNGFKEMPLQKGNFMLLFLVLFSASKTVQIWINYFRHKGQNLNSQ